MKNLYITEIAPVERQDRMARPIFAENPQNPAAYRQVPPRPTMAGACETPRK
jgi:hypothetical protein